MRFLYKIYVIYFIKEMDIPVIDNIPTDDVPEDEECTYR